CREVIRVVFDPIRPCRALSADCVQIAAFAAGAATVQTCRLVSGSLALIAAGMIPLRMDQMAIGIGRRQFMAALGGADGWPRVALGPPAAGRHSSVLADLSG